MEMRYGLIFTGDISKVVTDSSQIITTMCSFDVAKGEEKPVLGKVPTVNGVAHKDCNWQVPYQVSHSHRCHTIPESSMDIITTPG